MFFAHGWVYNLLLPCVLKYLTWVLDFDLFNQNELSLTVVMLIIAYFLIICFYPTFVKIKSKISNLKSGFSLFGKYKECTHLENSTKYSLIEVTYVLVYIWKWIILQKTENNLCSVKSNFTLFMQNLQFYYSLQQNVKYSSSNAYVAFLEWTMR